MTGQDNDLKKEALLDIQKILTEVLKIKGDIQMINQENAFFWIYTRGIKTLKKHVQ